MRNVALEDLDRMQDFVSLKWLRLYLGIPDKWNPAEDDSTPEQVVEANRLVEAGRPGSVCGAYQWGRPP